MFKDFLFTDRSAIQEFRDCGRKRFLSRHFKGRGLTPKAKSIPLTTGSEVHDGVKFIAQAFKDGTYHPEETVESAILDSKARYGQLLDLKGLRGINTSLAKDFTYGEQRAQIEALIRVWHLREFPRLTSRFDIISIEEDRMVPFGIEVARKPVFYQVKVDMILRDKGTKDYFVYSLKTTKMYTKRTEDSYKVDMQGLSEIWGTQTFIDSQREVVSKTLGDLEKGMGVLPPREAKATRKYLDYVGKVALPDRIMGVVFCFLVKGDRKEIKGEDGKGTGVWYDDSPLIRGYRRFDPGGVSYAHSLFFSKPENKSGFGRLGQGWEPFNVWQQDDLGVTLPNWIDDLDKQKIQPEAGDAIAKCVVTPIEVWRKDEEIEDWLLGAREQERKVLTYSQGMTGDWERDKLLISQMFPQNRNHCYWPTRCDFLAFCHKAGIKEDPFSNPDFTYEWRTPHHEFEAEQHLEIFGKEKETDGNGREGKKGSDEGARGEGEEPEIEGIDEL